MKKILVVDDEAFIATHLEESLTSMGYKVVGKASSGESAVDMAKQFRPDLILMDIVMPGKIDGINASRIIREELDIPVIFLTAYADDNFIKRAKNAGPYGYIVKPFQEAELRAVIEVALSRKKREQLRKKEEEKYRSLGENISDAIIVGDSRGRVIFWNKGAEVIFGYSADEAVGKLLTFVMPEEFRRNYQRRINRVISTENLRIIGRRFEVFGLRKDGSKFPLELSISRWRMRKDVFFSCVACDITKRKEADKKVKASLKEKELLLKEVHHRVKNNLTVIYSLLNLQSKYIKDKQALRMIKESKARIRSIALIHDDLHLFKGRERIDFANYIRNLVARLFHSYAVDTNLIKFKLDVDDIFLDIKRAVPCGLIISELVSNSLKYAFPDKREGEICIDFHRDREGRFMLIISDNGVGFPEDLDFRNTESLGLQIVTDFVEQLEAEIELDRKVGTKFKISF